MSAAIEDPDEPLSIHASAVVVGEAGIIIRGPSGAGKSSLALGLIGVAERAGHFARLVGDDRIELRRRGGRLIARGHPRISGMAERRGQGLVRMDFEPAAVARLIVELLGREEASRYPEATRVTFCGIKLPVLPLLKDAATQDSAAAILARLDQPETI